LCSLDRDKPFECVGETGESRAAMAALALSTDWRDHAVVSALAPWLEQANVPELAELLAFSGAHSIPVSILSRLNLEEESGETG